MRYKSDLKTCTFALGACGILLCSGLAGQNSPVVSLQEQLKAQYKVVKTGTDAYGLTVVDPGTVLSLRKGGVLGVPPQAAVWCPSKFQDGEVKGPANFCLAMAGRAKSRYLQVGEKVYPRKIEVSLDKDKISFQILECDSCNGVQEPSFYKAEVLFQFAKGSLKNAGVPQVEDTISQVLAIDAGDQEQAASSPQGTQDQTAPPAQQSPPRTIELGQTPDQVVAALGQPEKIVNLGAKQIYLYKDLKVTFMNGKVSDVQ